MSRSVKDTAFKVAAGVNVATVLVMICVGYSGCFNPVSYPFMSSLSLFFPVFLVANFLFMAFWVFFRLRFTLISFIGCILCFAPIRTYMPLNVGREVPEGAIKVLSYNVLWFAPWVQKDGEPNTILEYLKHSDAHIICLQEASPHELGGEDKLNELKKLYPYYAKAENSTNKDAMALFSKFPIIGQEPIEFESIGNMSMAFHLLIDRDTVVVINNHLETNSFTAEEKNRFKELLQGKLDAGQTPLLSRGLMKKLGDAARKRTPQAEAVARYIASHRGKSIIVCGDFNDNPLSFTHRLIAEGLTDCFVSSGNGPGFTYHESGMYVRIDNILCSNDFQPYGCKVDKSIKSSDHYPIYCWLKKKE